MDRGAEIRCYMRDPDGYLIEVGEATGIPSDAGPEFWERLRIGGESGAAKLLGLKRTTLQAKMRKLGIKRMA